MIHVYSSMQTANATIVHCLVTVFRNSRLPLGQACWIPRSVIFTLLMTQAVLWADPFWPPVWMLTAACAADIRCRGKAASTVWKDWWSTSLQIRWIGAGDSVFTLYRKTGIVISCLQYWLQTWAANTSPPTLSKFQNWALRSLTFRHTDQNSKGQLKSFSISYSRSTKYSCQMHENAVWDH